MKITICGSIAFINEMCAVQSELESLGHEARMPPTEIMLEDGTTMDVKTYYDIRKSASVSVHWVWDKKEEAMRRHFEKIVWADAILVLNYSKNNIEHYVGANTLIEMGVALYFRKQIYLLNPVPELAYKEEILGMKPIVLYGDLAMIMEDGR